MGGGGMGRNSIYCIVSKNKPNTLSGGFGEEKADVSDCKTSWATPGCHTIVAILHFERLDIADNEQERQDIKLESLDSKQE